MHDAAAPCARRIRRRRHQDHPAFVPGSGLQPGYRQWRLRYPLAGALPGKAGGVTSMAGSRRRSQGLTPEILLRAYSIGLFPMAESADDPEIFWVEPELRGILPLDDFHVD